MATVKKKCYTPLEAIFALSLVFCTSGTVCESTQPLAAAMCISLSPASEADLDRIVLKDGTALEGKIISENASGVTFEHSVAGAKLKQVFSKSKIAQIRRANSPAVGTGPATKPDGSAGAQRAAAPLAVKLSAALAASIGAIEVTAEVTEKNLESSNRFVGYKEAKKAWKKIDAKANEQGDGIPATAVEGRLKATHTGWATLSIGLGDDVPIPVAFIDGTVAGDCTFAVTSERTIQVTFQKVNCNSTQTVDMALLRSSRGSNDYLSKIATEIKVALVEDLLGRAKIGLAIDSDTLVMGKFAKVNNTWRVVPVSCVPLRGSERISGSDLKAIESVSVGVARYLQESTEASTRAIAVHAPKLWSAALTSASQVQIPVFAGCRHCTTNRPSYPNGFSPSSCDACAHDRVCDKPWGECEKCDENQHVITADEARAHKQIIAQFTESVTGAGGFAEMKMPAAPCKNHNVVSITKPAIHRDWACSAHLVFAKFPEESMQLVAFMRQVSDSIKVTELSPSGENQMACTATISVSDTVSPEINFVKDTTMSMPTITDTSGRSRSPADALDGSLLFLTDSINKVYQFDFDSRECRYVSKALSFDGWALVRGWEAPKAGSVERDPK